MRASWILVVLAACDPDPEAELQVSLQRLDDGCWQTVALAGVAAPDAETLGLPKFCDTTASPTLQGGTDRLRLLTAYGLELETTATVANPTITMRIDGVAQEMAVEHEQWRKEGRLVVLSSFDAPARAASELRFTIVAEAGLETTFPGGGNNLRLTAPTLAISEVACPTPDLCNLVGGVGTTPVELTLPSRVPGSATLTSTLGGIPQPESRSIMLVQKGDAIFGRDFVPVPASDKKWQLTARFGDLEVKGREVQLVAPTLTAALVGCNASCSVTAGSKRALRVTAPRGVQSTKASVSTYVNGAPSLVDVVFDLAVEDVAANTIEGTRELDVPNTPNAQWQIDVRVIGFRAPSVTSTIAP